MKQTQCKLWSLGDNLESAQVNQLSHSGWGRTLTVERLHMRVRVWRKSMPFFQVFCELNYYFRKVSFKILNKIKMIRNEDCTDLISQLNDLKT